MKQFLKYYFRDFTQALTQTLSQARSKTRTWRCLISFFILILTLTSCNFPQSISRMDQHRTEVAGILNPFNEKNPPLITAPPPGLPTVAPPELPPAAQQYLPPADIAGYITYAIQQGDTLPALAKRFNAPTDQFRSEVTLPSVGLLPVGLFIYIPDVLEDYLPYNQQLLPDSELIYGASVNGYDAAAVGFEAGGYLASYSESVKGEILMGPDIVQMVAIDTSTNPRLLLAIVEYQSGWVFGHPQGAENDRYPIGFGADPGLHIELMITARLLAQGFYGWRDGSQTQLTFYGGGGGRLAPELNAGSTALMRFFSSIYKQNYFEKHLFSAESFLTFYQTQFGNYWDRAAQVDPYLTNSNQQPELSLPIPVGEAWSLTGGPHITWQTGTPRGAVDFAPITGEKQCAISTRWAIAAAPGLVVRSDRGVVALDLDGDNDEGTGWVLIYLHMAGKDRVPAGAWVEKDALIGHPSCEGGQASGTHVHFARKFNGEWVGVGDPLPLVLSGWRAYAGGGNYEGFIQKGDAIVTARPSGSAGSTIIRDE